MKEKNKRKFGSFNNFVLLCRVKQQRKAIMRIAQIVTATVMAFILFPDSSNAQEYYYGEGDFGELVIKDDSMYFVSFYDMPPEPLCLSYDTGFYYRIGDTLFLNSVCKRKYEIIECSEQDTAIKQCNSDYIVKLYRMSNGNYYQINEFCSVQNPNNEAELFIGGHSFYRNDLIVIGYWGIGERFRVGKELPYGNYKIRILDNDIREKRIYLDEFPLLIKGKKLIPIDKMKNKECWINNGFYFPAMKKEKKRDKYKVIGLWYRGVIGLPNGYEIPKKPHWVYSIEPHWRE